MRLFLTRNKYPLLLFLIFLISELLVNPLGEFPLNDDWSYAKTVLILLQEGDLYIGTWCAMTLASHAYWGFLFVKLLGFSFLTLRLSTLVSSFIGVLTLFHLVKDISKNASLAFVAALTLLFSPIYFNLSNTFMTDVNFNAWLLLGIYFAHRFYTSQSFLHFTLVFVFSVLLVLCRQFGIVLPFCFTLSVLFMPQKKWLYFSLSAVASLLVLLIFKGYESFLHHKLPAYSSYILSNKVSLSDPDFFKKLWFLFEARFKQIAMHPLAFAAPLALAALLQLQKKAGWQALLFFTVGCGTLVISAFDTTNFFIGNVFTNMSLGPETFYDCRNNFRDPSLSHTYSETFKHVVAFFKLFFMVLSSTAIATGLYLGLRRHKLALFKNAGPLLPLLLAVVLAYTALLCTSSSFFDRYLLPLNTITLLMLAFAGRGERRALLIAAPLLLVLVYVSLAGTRDYLTLNRLRWQTYEELKKETGLNSEKINGGFEVNCWNDGTYSWWADYTQPENYTHVIQYSGLPGFEVMRKLPFKRCFPFKNDTLLLNKVSN